MRTAQAAAAPSQIEFCTTIPKDKKSEYTNTAVVETLTELETDENKCNLADTRLVIPGHQSKCVHEIHEYVVITPPRKFMVVLMNLNLTPQI